MEIHKKRFRTRETCGVSFSPHTDWKLNRDVVDPKLITSKSIDEKTVKRVSQPVIVI